MYIDLFRNCHKQFSKVVDHLSPLATHERLNYSLPLSTWFRPSLNKFSYSCVCVLNFPSCLIFSSLLIDDVEYLCMCLLATWISSLVKCLVFYWLLYWNLSFCIALIHTYCKYLLDKHIANIFSKALGFQFLLS